MHQGAIKQTTDLEIALKREPRGHLPLINDPNSKWAILNKQANRIYHYRLTQHNLSKEDKEALMLARNELKSLAASLKAVTALHKALTEE